MNVLYSAFTYDCLYWSNWDTIFSSKENKITCVAAQQSGLLMLTGNFREWKVYFCLETDSPTWNETLSKVYDYKSALIVHDFKSKFMYDSPMAPAPNVSSLNWSISSSSSINPSSSSSSVQSSSKDYRRQQGRQMEGQRME